MKLWASLIGALLTIGSPVVARAECGIQTWIGTPSGTVIPEHGSLYVFEEEDRAIPDDEVITFSDGVAHRWDRTRISDTVVRIDYAAGLASTITAAVGWETSVFTVSPAWRAPAAAPRAIQYWHHASEWTCSYADGWMIQVDQPVAAFRVRWTQAAFAGEIDPARVGVVTEYIEPARVGDNGRSVVEIGKHDCVARSTIPPEALAAGGALELFAIRFDGSEVPVGGLPAAMHTAAMRTSDGGVADAIGFPPAPETSSAPAVVTNADSGRALLALAAIGVSVLFAAMLLVGRKRAPTPIL